MTDEEALELARWILSTYSPEQRAHPDRITSLCLWVEDVSKRLPQPKKTRSEYMRDYMKLRRANKKANKEL